MYFRKIDHLLAGILCLICAVLGIVGYTRSPQTAPPKKVWFEAEAGDVVFDHRYHTALATCDDCHHDESAAEDGRQKPCRACHYYGEARLAVGADETHVRMIGAQCVTCHTSMDVPTGCDTCHTSRRFVFQVVSLTYPELPKEVIFEADAGRVTFDHGLHVRQGEDAPCSACHHDVDWESPGSSAKTQKNCRACHYDQAERIGESGDENHARFIGANCANCHDVDDCTTCHEF